MILYVDETENTDYFIVTGLLAESRGVVDDAYKRFKNSISNYPIVEREKKIVYTEFKSVLIDRRYRKIKERMLREIRNIHPCVIFSCFIKKGRIFNQEFKESTYLTLLSKIVSTISQDICVVYDAFNKRDFEEKIENRLMSYRNVQAVTARDSQTEKGLQFVDNLCSIIRRHEENSDSDDLFKIIEDLTVKI